MVWAYPIPDLAQPSGFAQPGKEMLQGELTAIHSYLLGGCGEDGSSLFSKVPAERMRGSWTQTAAWGMFTRCQEKTVHHEGGQTLEQAAQKGPVSVLRDTQNLTGHNPEHPNLVVPALSRLSDQQPPEVSSKLY